MSTLGKKHDVFVKLASRCAPPTTKMSLAADAILEAEMSGEQPSEKCPELGVLTENLATLMRVLTEYARGNASDEKVAWLFLSISTSSVWLEAHTELRIMEIFALRSGDVH